MGRHLTDPCAWLWCYRYSSRTETGAEEGKRPGGSAMRSSFAMVWWPVLGAMGWGWGQSPTWYDRQHEPPAGAVLTAGAPGEPAAGTVQVLRKGDLELTLLYVPSGWFPMGTNTEAPEFRELAARIGLEEKAVRDETPQRLVWVSGFWIGKTEVTNAQFAEFVKATGHRTYYDGSKWGWWRSEWMANGDSYPVVDVTVEDAQAFCDWCGCRLPSEAQWEGAARGPEGRLYPWGNEWDPAKLTRDSMYPVGCVRADRSWCGALDMAANVAEWCRDAYEERFYASPRAGNRDPECRDPKPEMRVIRGGCWHNEAGGCRAADRMPYPVVVGADIDVGFRVVRAR